MCCVVLYCIVLYCAVSAVKCSVLCCIVVYCIVLCYVVLCCIVSTYAGGYGSNNIKSGDLDGVLTEALLNQPYGICVDYQTDEIYFSDYGNHKIKKIGIDGRVTTIAGNGTGGYENGIGTLAQFNGPKGAAIDYTNKILYVADTNNQIIRNINLKTNNVDLFAGVPFTTGNTTGNVYETMFNNPQGLYCSSAGNLFVADSNNNVVKRISISGLMVTEYISEIANVSNIIIAQGENSVKNKQANLIYSKTNVSEYINLGCSIDCNFYGTKIIFGAKNDSGNAPIRDGKIIYSGIYSSSLEISPTEGDEDKDFGYDVAMNRNGNRIAVTSKDKVYFYDIDEGGESSESRDPICSQCWPNPSDQGHCDEIFPCSSSSSTTFTSNIINTFTPPILGNNFCSFII